MVAQFFKVQNCVSRETYPTPFGIIYHPYPRTYYMMYVCVVFEVPIFTYYGITESNAKCRLIKYEKSHMKRLAIGKIR